VILTFCKFPPIGDFSPEG